MEETTIKLKKPTHGKLDKIRLKDESYDDVVNRLITDHYQLKINTVVKNDNSHTARLSKN